jgi:transcriptional regulator with XRE-family HTH domain
MKKRECVEALGEFLCELREARGLTQTEVGRALERDQTFVSKYEKGIRRLGVFELMDVCAVLGYPFTRLCNEISKDQKWIKLRKAKPKR